MSPDSLAMSVDPAYAAVQASQVWAEVLDALNTYKLAYGWVPAGDEDGDYWYGDQLDAQEASAAVQQVRRAREELVLEHDPFVVHTALIEASRTVLDGPNFKPGTVRYDVEPYEPYGRPSTAMVDTIKRDAALDKYSSLTAEELLAVQAEAQAERQAILRDPKSSVPDDLSIKLEALGILISGGLPDPAPSEAKPVPKLEQGTLPSWIPEESRTNGVAIDTDRGPVTVRLISAAITEAALAEANAIYAQESERLLQELKDDSRDATAARDTFVEEHPVFERLRAFGEQKGRVHKLVGRLADRNHSFQQWAQERDRLESDGADAAERLYYAYAVIEWPDFTDIDRLNREVTRQRDARRQLAVDLGYLDGALVSQTSVGVDLYQAELADDVTPELAAQTCAANVELYQASLERSAAFARQLDADAADQGYNEPAF